MTLYEDWLKENDVQKDRGILGEGYQWHGRCLMEIYKSGDMSKLSVNYRDQAISRFSFAIPDANVLERIAGYAPLLEVGAGTGYWAYELTKLGVDVIATEPDPYSDVNIKPNESYGQVVKCSAEEAVRTYAQGYALMLIWPSLTTDWSDKALEQYLNDGGRNVVYVGEGHGGCTASDRFHELLDERCELIEKVRIPQWWGIRDYCSIYQAKGVSHA